MTLVLGVHSRDSMWVLVDRRLSYGGRRRPVDDAVKILDLETIDGRGLLAYAGLGATANGTEPSGWMSAVLRGRAGLTLEQALGILSVAATRELPNHLAQMPGPSPIIEHAIIIPAFVRGVGYRLYTIDNVINRKTNQHWYRYTRHESAQDRESRSPRICIGGTGGQYLSRRSKPWVRDLLRLINAHDRQRVSDLAVAQHLAALNYEAYEGVRDGSVGPRCIVVWRRRPDADHAPGAAHASYTGVTPDQDGLSIPTIANGMDVRSIAGLLFSHVQQRLANGYGMAALDVDRDEMNRQLAQLPSEPDEELR